MVRYAVAQTVRYMAAQAAWYMAAQTVRYMATQVAESGRACFSAPGAKRMEDEGGKVRAVGPYKAAAKGR
jgi:hypothetical protein